MTRIPALGSINAFMTAANSFAMLTPEEELAIGKEPRGEARDKLITSHIRLANSIAREYMGFRFELDDLISVAVTGLVKAAEKFDPARGRFYNIAISYIRAELNMFSVKNNGIVRIATTKPKLKLFFNLPREKSIMLQGTGRTTLSPDQMKVIADKLNVKVSEVREMEVRMAGGDVSMGPNDSDTESTNFFTFDDVMGDDTYEPSNMLQELSREWLMSDGICEALKSLSERERSIIHLRYMVEEPLTLHELGAMHGISAERVRQVEVRAIKKLRELFSEYA